MKQADKSEQEQRPSNDVGGYRFAAAILGIPVATLYALVSIEAFRREYPETNGPGSRPLLVVIDFVQIVGGNEGNTDEIRTRIAQAAYTLRDAANRLGCAVLAISSVARERLKTLANVQNEAQLGFDLFMPTIGGSTSSNPPTGAPVRRVVRQPDAIVGLGKESGEIEYSGDSVSVIARVQDTCHDGRSYDIVFATAKGRATGAMWSPLHFTGFGYEECDDHGLRVIDAWKTATTKREQARVEKADRRDQARSDKALADVRAVVAYVTDHPGCTVRSARAACVNNSPPRWDAVVASLGAALTSGDKAKGCTLDPGKLHPDHRPSADAT